MRIFFRKKRTNKHKNGDRSKSILRAHCGVKNTADFIYEVGCIALYRLDYSALIDSTGFFLAAENTGKNVATAEVTIAMPRRMAIEAPPNTKSDAWIAEDTSSFRILQPAMLPATPKTKQISAITNASEKKILNTSAPRAPTARRIPISFFYKKWK